MSRGVFVGFRTPVEGSPYGNGVRLLEKVYEDVAEDRGVVTIDATDFQVGGISSGTCLNCGQTGHRHKECIHPLKCGNCEQLGHTLESCPKLGRDLLLRWY